MDNNIKNITTAFVNLKENELTNAYVKEIMRYKPLSKKEEIELFEKVTLGKMATKAIESGELDDATLKEYRKLEREAENARVEIINRNQRFVYATAKRYSQDDTTLPDLISEANLGLMTAFETYNPELGNRFCTYAMNYIRRSINAYFSNNEEIIKKTNDSLTGAKIGRIQDKFFATEGRYPTTQEMADILMNDYNVKIKHQSDLYDLRVDSLNCGYDDEDSSAFENSALFVSHSSVTSDAESVYEENDYYDKVFGFAMSFLNEKEKFVISQYYALNEEHKDYSTAEIAEMLGMTTERIRQIKKTAIDKMSAHKQAARAFL